MSGSGPARRSDGSADRPADDVDDLVDVGVGFAALGRGPDTAPDVVLEDEDRDGIDAPAGRPSAEDVDTVSSRSIIRAIHRLAYKSAEPSTSVPLSLRAVTEVVIGVSTVGRSAGAAVAVVMVASVLRPRTPLARWPASHPISIGRSGGVSATDHSAANRLSAVG
jgi:hypothetical protein